MTTARSAQTRGGFLLRLSVILLLLSCAWLAACSKGLEPNSPPNQPTNPLPLNGGVAQTDVNVSWDCTDPDKDALAYDLYFGTSATPPIQVRDRTMNTYDPGILNHSSVYYWRVVAKDNNDNQTSGPVWWFTTMAAGNESPNPPGSPSPSDGAAGVSINVTLSWTSSDPDGDPLTHDVRLDTITPPVTTVATDISEKSFSVTTDLNYEDTYYWQVVVKDTAGNETTGPVWTLVTEAQQQNQPPNSPGTPSPSDGAVDVPVTTTLSWTSSDPDGDPLTHDVLFDNNNPPTNAIATDITDKFFDPPGDLKNADTYYWRVIVKDDHGHETQGPVWTFVTVAGQNQPPDLPGTPMPSNGAVDVPVNVTLDWNSSDPEGDPLVHDVYLDTKTPPATTVATGISETFIKPPADLQHGMLYYWRVVVFDTAGNETRGTIWSFTTAAALNEPPNAPGKPDPADGATEVPINVELTWTSSDPEGDPLLHDVFFDNSNPPVQVLAVDVPNTWVDVPGDLKHDNTYYWQVIVKDDHGNETPGPVWSFLTVPPPNEPPDAPSKPDPADGAVEVPVITALLWNATDPEGDPLRYDVHLDTANPPIALAAGDIADGFLNVELKYGLEYYWRVVVRDDHENETLGPVWVFRTVANQPPDPPSKPDPADGAVEVPVITALLWNATDPEGDPLRYDVHLDTANPPIALAAGDIADGFLNVELKYGLEYYWRVVVRDDHENETLGPVWVFRTGANQPPDAPGKPTPADGATEVSVVTDLRWNATDPEGDPLRYDVLLDTVNPPIALEASDIVDSFLNVRLNNGIQYYWQIVVKDEHGNETPGPVWTFWTSP